MYIEETTFTPKSGKTHHSILLRESYRVGKAVKKRTIANLTKCSPEEIAAIKLALKHKADLKLLTACEAPKTKEGLSIGGVWTIFQVAKQIGIVEALGDSRNGQLALWQVIARILEQGSRLSSVRLSETYAIASTIGLEEGFNEEALYSNLVWLSKEQAKIEERLFQKSITQRRRNFFLYDVTSSYLEGECNELADWGYNRDKKKGKKQIVIGVMTDENGNPVSTEVFRGNTQDLSTFSSQVEKAKKRFGCEKVTLVGDRGMIKSGQIEGLEKHGFHYITAITREQIHTLIKRGTLQLSLFDDDLCEIEDEGLRYIFRRNPMRKQEIFAARENKEGSVRQLLEKQNTYLSEHPKAKVETALKILNGKISRLCLERWVSVEVAGRSLLLVIDNDAKEEEAKLDGCYVIKTDLKKEDASLCEVHDRYKDLAMVESAFRTVKTDLEVRPIYVRREESTRGHVLVVMLAYMIMRKLDWSWRHLYLTVGEGLRSLSTITLLEVSYGGKTFQQVPEPREKNKEMLEALGIKLPGIVPVNRANVATRAPRRKSAAKR